MREGPETNEIVEIFKGFFLLLLLHLMAGVIIFALGLAIGSTLGEYSFLTIWIVGAIGFLFWQLLYVIPLIIGLRRRGKTGMMKGVIVCATLTALVNGACFLTFFR